MVLAYHAIFSAYGFWLPNDPRGSWSTWVGSWELFRYGPATKTNQRRSVAHTQHDLALRLAAKQALKYPPVIFDGLQARAVARGFSQRISKSGYVRYGCAILPDHVHLVLRRHDFAVEQMVGKLKQAATEQMTEEQRHPLARYARIGQTPPTAWVRKGWHCYLDSEQDIRRAIAYVQSNPIKEGHKPQKWNFVTPYPGASEPR